MRYLVRFLSVVIGLVTPLSQAAVLSGDALRTKTWQPDEALELQRALLLADEGDVVQLGEGVFAPFWVPIQVLFRGVGPERTTFLITEQTRSENVFIPEGSGTGGLENLSVQTAEGMSDYYWKGGSALVGVAGEASLKNLSIYPRSITAIAAGGGKVTIRNVSISGAENNGLHVGMSHKGSVIDGLTVKDSGESGFDLSVGNYSLGTFRNLKLSGDGAGAIVVSGEYTAVEFEGLDQFTLNDIFYQYGASKAGADPEEVEGAILEGGDMLELSDRTLAAMADGEEATNSSPARRAAASAYYAELARDSSKAGVSAALVTYVKALFDTGSDFQGQPYILNVLELELHWFVRTFGIDALEAILFDFPRYRWDFSDDYMKFATLFRDSPDHERLKAFASNPPPEEAPADVAKPQVAEVEKVRVVEVTIESVIDTELVAFENESPLATEEITTFQASYARLSTRIEKLRSKKSEAKSYLAAKIEATFKDRLALSDSAVLIPFLEFFPVIAQDGLPARRELLRHLPAELRRDVMLGLRGK